jgi:hypothetical protein
VSSARNPDLRAFGRVKTFEGDSPKRSTSEELTGSPQVRRRTRPVTTAEQHLSNSDPSANGGDPLHSGQE